MVRIVILDFDGTLNNTTNANAINTYKQAYMKCFCEQIGISQEAIRTLYSILEPEVRRTTKQGFLVDGHDVSLANADPLILNATIYQRMASQGVFELDQAAKANMRCHTTAYDAMPKMLRRWTDNLLDFLSSSQEYSPVIVSNSPEDKIREQLATIGQDNIEVIDNADKLIIVPEWDDVPEYSCFGSGRKTLLRRRRYGSILEKLAKESDQAPIVVGDNFEADLALPLHLEMDCVKVSNGYDIPCERKALKGRVVFADDLAEVLNYLRSNN